MARERDKNEERKTDEWKTEWWDGSERRGKRKRWETHTMEKRENEDIVIKGERGRREEKTMWERTKQKREERERGKKIEKELNDDR